MSTNALHFHQARLLIASLRRECRLTAKHLKQIEESGRGDAADAISSHAARMGAMLATLSDTLERIKS